MALQKTQRLSMGAVFATTYRTDSFTLPSCLPRNFPAFWKTVISLDRQNCGAYPLSPGNGYIYALLISQT
jgi:hypothetical protein